MTDWFIDATPPEGVSPDATVALMRCDVYATIDPQNRFTVTISAQDSQGLPFTVGVIAEQGVDLGAIDVLGQQLAQIVEQAAERSRS